jgi:hypothetical protein
MSVMATYRRDREAVRRIAKSRRKAKQLGYAIVKARCTYCRTYGICARADEPRFHALAEIPSVCVDCLERAREDHLPEEAR